MTYSNSYNFKNINIDEIIRDAYDRVGLRINDQTADNVVSAKRSLNFILTSWINAGLNLWAIRYKLLSLNNGQSKYQFPVETSDVLEVFYRFFDRVTDTYPGIPFGSNEGEVARAFDNNKNTYCDAGYNGNIGFIWDDENTPTVCYIGILSNTNTNYTLNVRATNANDIDVYNFNLPTDYYSNTEVKWIEIPQYFPIKSLAIEEIGGADLSVTELYFCSYPTDRIITRSSRADYMSMPNKAQGGAPTIYYLSRDLEPSFYLWPVFSYTSAGISSNQVACLGYTYVEMPQSIESLLESPAITWRFLEALTAALAAKLAIKYLGPENLQKTQYLESLAKEEFGKAFGQDKERVPLRIYGSYT